MATADTGGSRHGPDVAAEARVSVHNVDDPRPGSKKRTADVAVMVVAACPWGVVTGVSLASPVRGSRSFRRQSVLPLVEVVGTRVAALPRLPGGVSAGGDPVDGPAAAARVVGVSRGVRRAIPAEIGRA